MAGYGKHLGSAVAWACILSFLQVPDLRGQSLSPSPWTRSIPLDSLLAGRPAPNPTGSLPLDDALLLALAHQADVIAAAWHLRAASETRREESRLPNPDLEGLVENFGGSLGSGHTETTISAAQTLELGGDRGARARVAAEQQRLAEAELRTQERQVVLDTGERFLEVWWLEQRLRNLERATGVAQATVAAARERTRIGAAPRVESLRAQTVVAQHEIDRRGVEADLARARRELALQWGASEAAFDSVLLPAPVVPALPPPQTLVAELETHPDRMRAAAETAVEAARVCEARALRVPDLVAHGGVRHFQENGDTGFLTGVTITVPLWNRHGALVRSAEAERTAASIREAAVRRRLEAELTATYERLLAARDSYEAARTTLLPTAREALAELNRGYVTGRFSYLDQLDAQRAELEAELTEIQSQRDVWSARIALERLLGRSLEETTGRNR